MKIKEIRVKMKLSRAELSRLSGVPIRTLENWEWGKAIPRDVYQLRKVARTLGVTIEDLIEDIPTQNTDE